MKLIRIALRGSLDKFGLRLILPFLIAVTFGTGKDNLWSSLFILVIEAGSCLRVIETLNHLSYLLPMSPNRRVASSLLVTVLFATIYGLLAATLRLIGHPYDPIWAANNVVNHILLGWNVCLLAGSLAPGMKSRQPLGKAVALRFVMIASMVMVIFLLGDPGAPYWPYLLFTALFLVGTYDMAQTRVEAWGREMVLAPVAPPLRGAARGQPPAAILRVACELAVGLPRPSIVQSDKAGRFNLSMEERHGGLLPIIATTWRGGFRWLAVLAMFVIATDVDFSGARLSWIVGLMTLLNGFSTSMPTPIVGPFLWSPYPRRKWFLSSLVLPFLLSGTSLAFGLIRFGDWSRIAPIALLLLDLLLLVTFLGLHGPTSKGMLMLLPALIVFLAFQHQLGWGLHTVPLPPISLPFIVVGGLLVLFLLRRSFQRLTLDSFGHFPRTAAAGRSGGS